MEITFQLSTKGIKEAIKAIKEYKEQVVEKCAILCDKLADKGILVGTANTGEYGDLITFSKTVDPTKYGAIAIMFATSGTIKRQWLSHGDVKEADVSPLLMAEFGSGWKASDSASLPNVATATALGMGQGTFPGQTHAFDKPGWSWMDLDGKWHSSSGEEPTMPMFRAAMSMEADLIDTAREVFGE